MLQLKLHDLVRGLTGRRAARYSEFVIFADDLEEVSQLRIGQIPLDLVPLDDVGQYFGLRDQGRPFLLEISGNGTVRLDATVDEEPPSVATKPAAEQLLGITSSVALRNAVTKKGEGWAMGLVLGLFLGPTLPGDSGARRVLTVRFDSTSKRWNVYDGGLVSWMKRELICESLDELPLPCAPTAPDSGTPP